MDTHFPVIDLHCDLLAYLIGDESRSVHHPEVNCSLPQLKQGGVILQTLALFTETKKGSTENGKRQMEAFCSLPKEEFSPLHSLEASLSKDKVNIIAAIENASNVCEEDEPLQLAFDRIEQMRHTMGPILYISLTWNTENRFGGGNATMVGLKKDGEHLLEYLDGKGIAIDLSHTSDPLAEGILNTIDRKGLNVIPIASHSNFRSVMNHPRNLPDSLAKEIIRRGGVIGFNAVKKFVGSDFRADALRHVEHGMQLGASDHQCFGADFFFLGDMPKELHYLLPMFDEQFGNASCYPFVQKLMQKALNTHQIEKIAKKNVEALFMRLNDSVGR